MKKLLLLGALSCIFTLATQAIPAYPYPTKVQMEDGSIVTAQIHGDEFGSYVTDMQGNVIRGHKPSAEELANMSKMRRARQQEMIGSGFPLKGSPKSVAILLEFQDVAFTYTKADFEDLLMKSGYDVNGATGSCRDYFIACSDSAFQPQFDVYGPYKVSKNVGEYGGPGKSAAIAFKEAIQLAIERDSVDFSQYDEDGNGIVDNVFFYYAGHNEAEGAGEETIWPHASQFQQFSAGNMQFVSYACTSEMKGGPTNPNICAIGTFCHEFGHVLGLPDWYNTSGGDMDGKSDTYTIGNWSIMSAGNYNNESRTPPSYSAYERFYLGWLTPKQLTEPGKYLLNPMVETKEAYIITANNVAHNMVGKTPNPNEFFVLEYRAAKGWDAPAGALPGTGMLIWHIDYKGSTWASNSPNNNTPMGYHLEEADGRKTYSSPTDAYPGTKNITFFNPKLHSGTNLQQPIYKIEEKGGAVSFVYINEGVERVAVEPKELDFTITMNDSDKPTNWASQIIRLTGFDLDLGEKFTLTVPDKSNFYLSKDSMAQYYRTSKSMWTKSVVLDSCVSAIDSTLDVKVYVSYNPKARSCSEEEATLSISSQSSMLTVPMVGRSPRATTITTPAAKHKNADVTPYAFTITWKSIADAENYYLYLYSIEEGTSDIVQSFENFSDREKIQEEGWQVNEGISTSTAAQKDGKRSVLFKKTGDYIITEKYPTAITKISFWVNTISTTADSVGSIMVEASSDGSHWTEIKSFAFPKNTKAKICSVEMNAASNYSQFRLTYTNIRGAGTLFDAFTATTNQKVTYIYKGKQNTIEADASIRDYSYTFTGLTPKTTYYYQIQCGEDKGCEEHLTTLSDAKRVQTLDGEPLDSKLLTMASVEDKDSEEALEYNRYTRVIYLPFVDENYSLFVYDLQGRLVWSTAIVEGQSSVVLPSSYFVKGKMYAAKYTSTNKMARKDKWIKFMY